MQYRDHIYRGSYVISPESIVVEGLEDYNAVKLGDYHVYYSRDVHVDSYHSEGKKAVLVGYCFDTRNENLPQAQVVENLITSNETVKDLEYINGRYFLLISDGVKTILYSDASQLQPLVYHEKSRSLSSHDHLLASVLKRNGYEVTRRPLDNHTELDFTRFEGMYKMNPSLSLALENFGFERIYPRNALKRESVENTFKEMAPLLKSSSSWVEDTEQDIFLTVTAGIDSRVSAAMTRPFKDRVEYLTYYTPSKYLATNMAKTIHRIDRKVAEQMKENLGWNHSIISIRDFNPSGETFSEWSETLNSRHAFGLINYYREHKKYHHALHIKSTVFGMGKADFKKELDQHEDTYHFYKACIHGLPKDFEKYYDVEKEIEGYFDRNLVHEGVTQGRHYFDLFHLESRMGNWHSTLTLETDPEVDEFIFMNTRRMIDLMQQPSIEERRNFALYKTIVNHFWPVLLHFGINKEKNIHEQSLDTNDADITIQNVRFSTESGMDIDSNEMNSVLVKPGKGKTNVHDINHFKIENEGTEPKTVLLKSHYTNSKGKGIIKVIIRTAKKHKVYDILSLNEPIELELDNEPYTIMVLYNDSYDRASWRDAGKLEMEIK